MAHDLIGPKASRVCHDPSSVGHGEGSPAENGIPESQPERKRYRLPGLPSVRAGPGVGVVFGGGVAGGLPNATDGPPSQTDDPGGEQEAKGGEDLGTEASGQGLWQNGKAGS